jgi:outer membrane usher protein
VSPLKTPRRLLALIALSVLLTPSAVRAQSQRAVLDVLINEVAVGESLVVMRGSEVLVGTQALTDAGLQGFAGNRELIGGQEFVSLTSLAPAVSFRVDELELRLYITASPELLGQRVYDLYSGAPRDLVFKANTSGFVNYAVNYTSDRRVDLFAESALSMRGVLLYNTVSAIGQTASRGLTNVTVDQRAHMRRWIFGDNLGFTGPLGGDAWVAGITVAKEFAINPYFVRHPTLSLSTPINVPSVMEIQVNGQVVRREQVAPGRLEVRNLPMALGRNDAQVIVRDAFGVERELSSTYYLTTTALAEGVHDYQYSVGFRRQGIGDKSWDYRTPVALARHRVGLSDSVTLGGRVETHPGRLYNAGPSLNLRLPFAEVEAAAAVSRTRGEWGTASLVGFNVSRRQVSAGGSVRLSSRRYATLTPNPQGEDPATEANVFASAALGGPVSVTMQHSLARLHQGITRARTGILSTIHLARNMELTTSVADVRDERTRGKEVYAGFTILLGRSATASVGHVRDGRGNRMTVDAQRSLPVGEGYGYQFHGESGDNSMATGVARYQGRYGRYELRQETLNGDTHTTASTAGSIVGIGGGVYASRPVQDSYALVRVPGVKGVRAYSSHQEVGKTGRGGDLLVPDLQAYYANILDVADGDIPLQYAVPDVNQTLALPYRGGAVAVFDVQKIQRVVGSIRVADQGEDRIPNYGELVVTAKGRELTSPIGGSGRFYFEDLSEGTHSAVVRDSSGRECTFTITVPSSDGTLVNLGTLRCEARQP